MTSWLYSHPEQLAIHNIRSEYPYNTSIRMTIDTIEDLRRIEDALRHTTYGNSLIDYNSIYKYLQKEAELNQSLNR